MASNAPVMYYRLTDQAKLNYQGYDLHTNRCILMNEIIENKHINNIIYALDVLDIKRKYNHPRDRYMHLIKRWTECKLNINNV